MARHSFGRLNAGSDRRRRKAMRKTLNHQRDSKVEKRRHSTSLLTAVVPSHQEQKGVTASKLYTEHEQGERSLEIHHAHRSEVE